VLKIGTTITGLGLYLAALVYGIWFLTMQWFVLPPVVVGAIALVVGIVVLRGTQVVLTRIYPTGWFSRPRVRVARPRN
jgi:hypothetical protein